MVLSHWNAQALNSQPSRNITQIRQDTVEDKPEGNSGKKKHYRPDQVEQFHISKQLLEPTTGSTSPSKNDVKRILTLFREKVSDRGCRGALAIARLFRIADDDNSNSLD